LSPGGHFGKGIVGFGNDIPTIFDFFYRPFNQTGRIFCRLGGA
jgi:hypothetical protein